MQKTNFEFEVYINGHPAKEYYQNGTTYIEGREGTKFSLRFKNNSWSKVLFVPTIDGLSVMDGKEGSFDSRGYIVNAYDSLTIEGWRTSNESVAEFFFSSPKGSYAKKMNKGGNLGVIGGAVFTEKFNHHFTGPSSGTSGGLFQYGNFPDYTVTTSSAIGTGVSTYTCKGSNATNSINTSCYSAASNLGTGFGQDKPSSVTTVSFNKEDSPAAVFTIYYNTRQILEKLGITFTKPIYITPNPFPNEEGFCKRPY